MDECKNLRNYPQPVKVTFPDGSEYLMHIQHVEVDSVKFGGNGQPETIRPKSHVRLVLSTMVWEDEELHKMIDLVTKHALPKQL